MAVIAERDFRCRIGPAAPAAAREMQQVAEGLGSDPKSLSFRTFLTPDAIHFFREFTAATVHEPARAECEILTRHARDIAAAGGNRLVLADADPLSLVVAGPLVRAVLKRQGRLDYYPVDPSVDVLRQACLIMTRDHPTVNAEAFCIDAAGGLERLLDDEPPPALIALGGWSLAALDRASLPEFLGHLRARMRPYDLVLAGFDLRAEARAVLRTYDDAAGRAARFNLSLLDRINRAAQGDIPVGAFEHLARYDVGEGRVDLLLRSRDARFTRLESLDRYIWFEKDETILTGVLHLRTPGQIAEACALAGLRPLHEWVDSRERRALALLAPSANPGLFGRRRVSAV